MNRLKAVKGLFILLVSIVLLTPTFAQTSKQKRAKDKTNKVLADTLKTINLDAVNITATRLLFVSKKDTMVYNLNALALEEGALLGDALQRLPGIQVKDGKLFYKGQAVDRLLINGIDFAKEDPNKALHALPAYIVNKVKAFSQMKESSRLKGYDDGSRDIVLDVRLKKKYQGTWTGEAELGAADGTHYLAQGFANTFTDSYRVSLFGNANNINQQRWYKGSGQVTDGYKGQWGGLWEFIAPGGTFFWKTKAQQGKKGYFIIEGDTDYDREKGFRQEEVENEQYLINEQKFFNNRSQHHSLEHRWAGHLNFEWCPTEKLLIVYKPNLELKLNKMERNGLKAAWNENPFQVKMNLLDSLAVNPSHWDKSFKPIYLNQFKEQSNSPFNLAWHKIFIRQMLSPKSSIKLEHVMWLRKANDNDDYSLNGYNYFKLKQKERLQNRYYDKNMEHLSSETSFAYMRNFDALHLELNYKYNILREDHADLGYRLDRLGGLYADYKQSLELFGSLPDNFETIKTSIMEEETSQKEQKRDDTHSLGLVMNYNKEGYFINLSPELQHINSELTYQKGKMKPISLDQKVWTPKFNLHMGFNDSKKGLLNISCSYYTNFINLRDKIEISNHSNPLYIILGNPDLKNQQTFFTTLMYHKTFDGKINGKAFQPSIGTNMYFSNYHNKFVYKTAYDRVSGVTTSMPVNLNEYYLSGSLNFTTPLELKQRLLLNTELSYTRRKNQSYAIAGRLEDSSLDNIYANAYSIDIKPMLRLSKFNCSIGYTFSIEKYSSGRSAIDGRRLYQQKAMADFSWKMPWGINFSGNCNYSNYSGNGTKVMQQELTILNLSLQKSFLKDKALTVFVRANDLLNQNDRISTYFYESNIIRHKMNQLGRHVLVGLKYRFSTKPKQ